MLFLSVKVMTGKGRLRETTVKENWILDQEKGP